VDASRDVDDCIGLSQSQKIHGVLDLTEDADRFHHVRNILKIALFIGVCGPHAKHAGKQH
jgi:hypothetical protein